ncbi:hypothetical protein HNV12_01785 [Methanococcoides sp. SA1]|nr:hypothetical protein [Methanococcoides sp. SA1]
MGKHKMSIEELSSEMGTPDERGILNDCYVDRKEWDGDTLKLYTHYPECDGPQHLMRVFDTLPESSRKKVGRYTVSGTLDGVNGTIEVREMIGAVFEHYGGYEQLMADTLGKDLKQALENTGVIEKDLTLSHTMSSGMRCFVGPLDYTLSGAGKNEQLGDSWHIGCRPFAIEVIPMDSKNAVREYGTLDLLKAYDYNLSGPKGLGI